MINMNVRTVFGFFILGLILIVQPIIAKTEPAHLDKIVAVVNTDVITQQELDRRVTMMKRQFEGDNASQKSSAELRQRVLDGLIDVLLQLQAAKKQGIEISDKELNAVIANIAKSHNITVAKLKEVLPEQEGMSFSEFRKQIREQGVISRVQQGVLGGEITVSAKDIEAILRNPPAVVPRNVHPQYHVVDVLFEMEDGATKDQVKAVKKAAEKTAIELQGKGNIDEVIKKSQDNFKESIKSEDLGWRRINELPELFAKEVAKMKVNQVIGPIQAPNGLHLLKLLAINGPSSVSAKITRDQAGEIVYRRKLSEKLGPWLKELRESAYIKINK